MNPVPPTHPEAGHRDLASAELELVLTERARADLGAGRFDDAAETLRVARMLFPDSPGPLRATARLEERRGQRLRADVLRRIARRLEERGLSG